ncbi:MAG: amino acid adenylation domain-containing protein [Planctomycetaceae bacterium]|nr:amino acid adenylation domain-containing protein [Planctomycetaceae bacterium]
MNFCTHQLFEAQVEESPSAIAIRAREGCWTYRELNRRSNQVANYLRTLGVRPECLVGLCLPRSLDLVAGMLGVLKAGGAYVPLDPVYPRDRLSFMLADSQVSVLITSEEIRTKLPEHSICTTYLDTDRPVIERQPDTNPTSGSTPDDLAYVIFTSGSTGRPKGAMILHRGLSNYLRWCINAYDVASGQGAPVHSSVSFDLTVTSLFAPLLVGRRVDLLDEDLGVDQLAAALRDNSGYSLVKITPAHLQLLGRQLAPHDAAGRTRAFVIGGEQLTAEHIAFWQKHAPDTLLFNEYGPTETVVGCCVYRVPSGWPANGVIPIGRPIDNTQLYVLDDNLNPLPDEAVGELYIGGAGVARGYLNQPELTARKFIGDPFGPEPGARLYRTGDLCRRRRDGELEYMGRVDHQVKIRGHRIEPGEVEARLREIPEVAEVVVVAREDEPGRPYLAAYVVPVPGTAAPDAAAWRAFLKKRLPDYMVPTTFTSLECLPLTPNGKFNMAALPRPERPAATGSRAPDGELENTLAEVWKGVLHLEKVGARDNFFHLGGDSLNATQVTARLGERLGVEVPLPALFNQPTVEELAAWLQTQHPVPPRSPLAITTAPRGEALPLSFSQERAWFFEQWAPGSPAYHIAGRVGFRTPVKAGWLEESFRRIIARHEVLRTVFRGEGGRPTQVILPELEWRLDLLDLSPFSGAEGTQRTLGAGLEHARRPFDLGHGPLLRALLVQRGDQSPELFLTLHHIIADGWSLSVLVEELGAVYNALAEGREPALPPLPHQFADFALSQRHWLRDGALEPQLAFWRERLAHAPPPLELPGDGPRPPLPSFQGAVHEVRLPGSVVSKLEEVPATPGTTTFMRLLAAFYVFLFRYTGRDDLCVGTPISNRHFPGAEAFIGFLVNTLVVRARCSGDLAFEELLREVRESTLGAYANQDVPFERLVEELNPERDVRYPPLFQVMFAFQNTPGLARETPHLAFRLLPWDIGAAKFDLLLNVTRDGEGYVAAFEYRTDLFLPERVARMAGHFLNLLRNLASQPTVPLAGIPLASGEETEQLLRWSRGPVLRAGEAATVLDLIRQHVTHSPEAAALVCDRATLTYAALNQQALGLARQLQSRGAGPGTFVGILLERSPDWLWALVGVLESGAAYLPLDPATPPDRLGEILRDARPAVVVTSRALADRLAAHMELVCLTEDVKPVTGGTGIPPDPDSPAYLIYTSGSTGRPKGVVATHRNLLGSTLARLQYYPEPVRRFLLLSPFTFDSSVAGVFWTLAQGGTLVLPKASASDVTAVVEDIERLGVSHTLCIPSLYRLILDRAAGGELLSLRAVIVAGESCPESLARRHSEKAPWCRLYNEYGPTEATVWCTVYESPASGGRAGPQGVSIGRPIPGAEVFVLDGDRKPVPVGIPGEIYVGGVGVTRGYWDRPELTAQAFLAHPFSPGARVYRTGDLGCFLPSGDIEYLGRKDGQVKVRGFRIELGEIEHALARHPAVEEAAVVKIPGRESLTAFVAPKDPAAAASLEDELRRFLREALPAPLVPSSFVALPALPRTAHGKIDRSALLAPERSCHDVGLTVIEPSSDCERRLRSVWEEVLGVTPIGVEDDFIKLGGDSLIATVLLVRIEKEFGKSISPSILLRGGSIRQLARLLAGEAPPQQESLTVQLREGSGRPLFILPGIGGYPEELIHLASHLNAGRPIYSFRSPGQDGVSEPIDGIELLAMHYLEMLRSVQPKGPYLVVGYSFGGTIAFEMALQLHAVGERVDYLAILDKEAPREFIRPWLNPAYTASVAYKFVRWATAGFFRSAGRKEHAATIALSVSTFLRVWKDNLSRLLGLGTGGSIISSEITQAAALPTPLSRLITVNRRAEMRYRPRIYPGRVLLYRVRSEPPRFRATRLDMGWGRFVQQDVDVRFLEGNHLTFHKDPGARLLAERIEADLALIESLCVDHAS